MENAYFSPPILNFFLFKKVSIFFNFFSFFCFKILKEIGKCNNHDDMKLSIIMFGITKKPHYDIKIGQVMDHERKKIYLVT